LTLVALTSLTSEETGGTLPLASGALHYTAGFEDMYQHTVGGFLTSGSLVGTVIPEPAIVVYFGLFLAGLFGAGRTARELNSITVARSQDGALQVFGTEVNGNVWTRNQILGGDQFGTVRPVNPVIGASWSTRPSRNH
jgi:hypothetical protein